MNFDENQRSGGLGVALRRCSEWLEGRVSPEDLRGKQISGGITNVLFHVEVRPECHAKLAPWPAGFREHGVGVRFYGPSGSCDVVDRNDEVLVTQAAAPICKKTYYRFEGGQIDEWLDGRPIDYAECLQSAHRDAMATHLARFHLVPFLSCTDVAEEHAIVRRLRYWLTTLSQSALPFLPLPGAQLLRYFLEAFDLFRKDYAEIDASPVAQEVLCHNDLLPGNIVLTKANPRGSAIEGTAECVEFIDYEYASKGWNVYDLANHFVESASSDWSKVHDPAYVRAFCSTYLDYVYSVREKDAQRTATTASSPRDADEESTSSPSSLLGLERGEELDEYMRLIELCMPLTHFYWGVWGLAQLANSRSLAGPRTNVAKCDFLSFAAQRYARWQAGREQYLQATSGI